MADVAGYVALGMTSQTVSRGYVTNAQTFANALPASAVTGILAFPVSVISGLFEDTGEGNRSTPIVTHGAYLDPAMQQFWFEKVHSFPTFFELGNILTTITRDLEIYNAYRDEARTLTVFTNNADSGVTVDNIPPLPATIAVNNGLLLQVVVSTTGPPQLDGSLDFTLDTGIVIVPITGSRVVMFPFEPESPVNETLQFKTNVLQATDSAEQRVSIRKHPRQILSMKIKTEDDSERRKLQTLMSSWQPRVFGLPIWFEGRPLTSPASALDTTIQVDTSYGDFRVGSLAIVWSDSETFDALEVASLTPTSITFSSSIVHDYETAVVMPLRVAVTESQVGRVKWPVNLSQMTLRFTVLDNQADIASTAAFNSYNGKVMLDDPNLMSAETHDDNLLRSIERIDNQTASLVQFSDWSDSLPLTKKGFLADSLQAVWQVRQLVHALRGSQLSFYLPTFYTDMVLAQDLSAGSFLMDIENIGYSNYMDARQPNKSLWIQLTDGTILTREVQSTQAIDENTERLVVDVAWASTVTVAEVERICLLRLVRIADDEVRLMHDYAGDAKVNMNLVGVIQ